MNHGHVVPNADGSKARCGGPGFCTQCSLEAGTPPEKIISQSQIKRIQATNPMKLLEIVEEIDRLRDSVHSMRHENACLNLKLEQAESLIKSLSAYCGHPDAAEACRIVIRKCGEYFEGEDFK
jgi:transcriptional regulator of met regulon